MQRELTEWEMSLLDQLVNKYLREAPLAIRCDVQQLATDLTRVTRIKIFDSIKYEEEKVAL